jgi:hypothetical protein
MDAARATMSHLLACLDTTYRVLGEAAPTFTRDANVLRVYEAARAIGGSALRFRECLGVASAASVAPLEAVLRRAAQDETGAMTLFCLVSVVGPRLLVSLRDAREAGGLDPAALEALDDASSTLIREMHAVGAAAIDEPLVEDEAWQARARGLARTLEEAGYAESFGPAS